MASRTEFRVYSSLHTANGSRMTRTHHSRLWTSLTEQEAARGARTHTQYTLFDECLAPGPSGFTPRRSLIGWHRRHSPCQRSPTPTPTYLPQSSLLDQATRAWRRPVCPPSGEGSAGATCVARHAHGHAYLQYLCSRPCIDEGFQFGATLSKLEPLVDVTVACERADVGPTRFFFFSSFHTRPNVCACPQIVLI
eukprot:scaffold84224_cov57-Phaeocystis_antarctica.AAC.5